MLHLEPLDLALQHRLEQTLAVLPPGAIPQDVQRLLDDLLPWVQQCFGMAQWRREMPELDFAEEHLNGPDDRVRQLIERFDLDDFERDVLLLCALLALDGRYSTVIACLQMDMHKNQLTVDTTISLLCEGLAEQVARRGALSAQGRLLRHGLLQLKVGTGPPGSQVLLIEPGVMQFLLGQPAVLAELEGCGRWLRPSGHGGEASEVVIRQMVEDFNAPAGQRPVLLLRGRTGDGREAAVAMAAALSGRETLALDVSLLPEQDIDAMPLIALALREACLRDALLLISGAWGMVDGRKRLFARLGARLQQHCGPVVCLNSLHEPPTRFSDLPHLTLDMPERAAEDDEALLRARLDLMGVDGAIDLGALVRRFSLTPETLDAAIAEAELYQRRRSARYLESADLSRALRLRSQQDFGKLAHRIEPRRGFKDLVVDASVEAQLREILAAVRHRVSTLQGGFLRKIAYGAGISALFFGDSGTGKTMAAEVLAHELEVDLIKIDLSTVVNKYIGETEKHLAKVFDLAEQDSGVLFFDEADALFGKRTEAKDSHDRHANIEVSYLLQRLEDFKGLVILSTNNRSHLDAAFNRRLTFVTRFGPPDVELRERLWREIWPANVNLGANVDLPQLAQKYDVTGANIRNIALLSTWLASQEGAASIQPDHIDRAARREMTKIGRMVL